MDTETRGYQRSEIKKDPRILKRFTSNSLTFNEERVLITVRAWPGVTCAELSRAFSVHPMNINHAIHKLAARELIHRKPLKIIDDSGSIHQGYGLYLTEKGKVAYNALHHSTKNRGVK